jgi:HNH endonuclease
LKIARWLDRCIVCLNGPTFSNRLTFSEEHIIPRALGGRLTCEFLCKSCNDSFGSSFEAKAKSDPSIRLAIQELRTELPALYAAIEKGQKHLILTGVGPLAAYYRNGWVQNEGTRLNDGSLIVPDHATEHHLKKMMTRDGLGLSEIERALAIFRDAPFEEKAKLTTEITVVKRQSAYGGPNLAKGELLDPLVALKIAYEYSVLLMGVAALDDQIHFNELRRCLQEKDINSQSFKVERLQAEKHDPFHGIGFEGNKPHVTIQIRLFGLIAYRVHFVGLSFNLDPTYYTHNLVNGAETFRSYQDAAPIP